MKRREFLALVGAVPIATYFAQMPVVKPLLRPIPNKLLPWQQHIWAMLESGKKVMYVTGTQKNAWHIFNLFQRHKRLFATSIHSAITGRRADLIIMDDFTEEINQDWYDCALRTRLVPGGEIEWIHT